MQLTDGEGMKKCSCTAADERAAVPAEGVIVWGCGKCQAFLKPLMAEALSSRGLSASVFAFNQQGSCNASFPLHLHRGGRCCTAGRPPLACSLFWMHRFVFLSLCFTHLLASSPSHPPAESVLLDSARRDPAPCW